MVTSLAPNKCNEFIITCLEVVILIQKMNYWQVSRNLFQRLFIVDTESYTEYVYRYDTQLKQKKLYLLY